MNVRKLTEKTVLLWKEKTKVWKKARDGNITKTNWASFRSKLRGDKIDPESKYERWSQSHKWACSRLTLCARELGRLEIWGGSLKKIEGHFGSGVASYFVLLRQLFFMNVLMNAMVFSLIIVPQAALPKLPHVIADDIVTVSKNCSWRYQEFLQNSSRHRVGDYLVDLLQGTGWLENTVLFYGRYHDGYLGTRGQGAYSIPLAYLTVSVAVYVVSLVLMATQSARSFKNNIAARLDNINQSRYISMIFCEWDYGMSDPKSARIKHAGVYQEMTGILQEERDDVRRSRRTIYSRLVLYAKRACINTVVVCLLLLSGLAIYHVTQYSLMFAQDDKGNKIVLLVMDFLPSITIAALNMIVPVIFGRIVGAEDYRPTFQLNITLVRTVFLRLASVLTLIATMYKQMSCQPRTECKSGGSDKCLTTLCWETYVGQNFYRLIIMDLGLTLIGTILEYPLRYLAVHYPCRMTEAIGQGEFDIPKNVLDLVYSQMLYWIGFFFSPFIPIMAVVKTVAVFYLKKKTCLVNYTPPHRPYRASRSNEFFMIVMILSYFCCVIPVGYAMTRIPPSRACGPFRMHDTMYDVVTQALNRLPPWMLILHRLMSSPAALIIVIVILSLLLYYWSVMSAGFKIRNQSMKEQLKLMRRDKQFLLRKLRESNEYRAGSQVPSTSDASETSFTQLVFDVKMMDK